MRAIHLLHSFLSPSIYTQHAAPTVPFTNTHLTALIETLSETYVQTQSHPRAHTQLVIFSVAFIQIIQPYTILLLQDNVCY